MKIAVLGSGEVGQTLAAGLAAAGHDVRIASRSGDKLGAFSASSGVAERSFADAAAFAEVVVLAVQGAHAESVLRSVAGAVAGKVVLDTANPISGPPKDGMIPYFTGADESLIQRLQAAVPAARVVKWFNSVGAGLMVRPALSGGTPSMFLCGDDADSKAVAASLAADLGWRAEDVGGAAMGHAVEALCQLWCGPGFARGDWAHAFAMLRP